MRVQVIEAMCQPAGTVNEDRWGTREGAVWLLDGATGLAAQRVLPGPSDALWLVDEVDAGLRERATCDEAPAEILRPIVRKAQQEVSEFHRFQRLCGEIIAVSEKICALRPVEDTFTPEEKKRRKRSMRKSRAK